MTPIPLQAARPNANPVTETEEVGNNGEQLPAHPPSYESHRRHNEEDEEDVSGESEREEDQVPSTTSSVQAS